MSREFTAYEVSGYGYPYDDNDEDLYFDDNDTIGEEY